MPNNLSHSVDEEKSPDPFSCPGWSSSFARNDDGFSLTKTTGSSTDRAHYDYSDDNGAVVQRGSFSTSESENYETISQVSTTETNGDATETILSREDAGGHSDRSLRGNFADEETSRIGTAALTQSQTARAASQIRYTATTSGAEQSQESYEASDQATTITDSAGVVSLENGEVVQQATIGSRGSDSRSISKWSQYNTATTTSGDVTTQRTSAGQGSTDASATEISASTSSGPLGAPGHTIGSGSQSVRTESAGRESTTVQTNSAELQHTERTNTAGTSSVRLDAMAAGAISDGPGGSTSELIATVSQSGGSTSRAKQTVDSDDGAKRERSEATYAAKGDSSQSFSGAVNQDEQHRTSRSGTTTSAGSGKNDATASYHAYSNDSSGAFPTFEIYTGAEGGTVNIFSNGFLESDHNAVSARGSTNAKTTGDEASTYRTGSSNFSGDLSSFTWTWTNTTVVDGADSSSDATSDYEEEQDLTEEGQSDGEAPAEDDSDGADDQDDGSLKVTSQQKVIDETGRISWDGTTGSNFNRQDDTTTTTKVGGGKDQTSTAVEWSEAFFSLTLGADPTTHTIRETGNETRTFTTAGAEPGDEQELEITRELDRVDWQLTTYATGQFAEEQLDHVGSSFSYSYDRNEVVTKTAESTNYHATHKLGTDGRTAVGGKLTADHEKTVTTTTSRSGDAIDLHPYGQTDYRTKEYEDVDKLSIAQHEKSRYEGGFVVGGSATTTITTTSDLTVDFASRLFVDESHIDNGTHTYDFQIEIADRDLQTQWIVDVYADGNKETSKSDLSGQSRSEKKKTVFSRVGSPTSDHTITKNDHYTRQQVDGKILWFDISVDRQWVHIWGSQSHGHEASPLDSPNPGTDPLAPWGPDWNKLEREYDDPEHEADERYATRWDGEDDNHADTQPQAVPVVQQVDSSDHQQISAKLPTRKPAGLRPRINKSKSVGLSLDEFDGRLFAGRRRTASPEKGSEAARAAGEIIMAGTGSVGAAAELYAGKDFARDTELTGGQKAVRVLGITSGVAVGAFLSKLKGLFRFGDEAAEVAEQVARRGDEASDTAKVADGFVAPKGIPHGPLKPNVLTTADSILDAAGPSFKSNWATKVTNKYSWLRDRIPGTKTVIEGSRSQKLAQAQEIIMDRVSRGGGVLVDHVGSQAIKYVDGGVSYFFRLDGTFWGIRKNN